MKMKRGALLFLLSLLLAGYANSANGQGMVPLSEVKDHPPSEPEKRPLSSEKVDAHKKIAKVNLQNKDEVPQGQEEVTGDGGKVVVGEKPESLQNPLKHASEEPSLIPFLLSRFPLSTTAEEQIEILQNLENYSHKFENGRDLFQQKGFIPSILLPSLNSSQPEVRVRASALIAVAAQNNAEVQGAIVGGGALRPLLHLTSFDPDPRVRGKALFAVTTIVRNFRAGQEAFLRDGGIPVVVKVAGNAETRKRSLQLVTDMLEELNHSCTEEKKCEELEHLREALKGAGWCELLSDILENFAGFSEDDRSLGLDALSSSLPTCSEMITSSTMDLYMKSLEGDEDFEEKVNKIKRFQARVEL